VSVRIVYRLHDQQERVTSMTYSVYSPADRCPDVLCRYSSSQLHYHCNWVWRIMSTHLHYFVCRI